MTEHLDLSPFTCAVATLKVALDAYEQDPSNDFVRDACIQRFEYCYDLSTKFMKRHVSFISENPEAICQMSFQELVRTAYTKGLLQHSWDQWWVYRDQRNITSHTYSHQKAVNVVIKLPAFYEELSFFLDKLQAYHA